MRWGFLFRRNRATLLACGDTSTIANHCKLLQSAFAEEFRQLLQVFAFSGFHGAGDGFFTPANVASESYCAYDGACFEQWHSMRPFAEYISY